jgi:arylsulfatase
MKSTTRVLFAALVVMLLGLTTALAQQKPNNLVIFGEDVGVMNLSAYHRGMMGGSTPNLGCIANEGALFTDY